MSRFRLVRENRELRVKTKVIVQIIEQILLFKTIYLNFSALKLICQVEAQSANLFMSVNR